MASFFIVVVASKNNVSFGAILWKTTLEIEDLPLLVEELSKVERMK